MKPSLVNPPQKKKDFEPSPKFRAFTGAEIWERGCCSLAGLFGNLATLFPSDSEETQEMRKHEGPFGERRYDSRPLQSGRSFCIQQTDLK